MRSAWLRRDALEISQFDSDDTFEILQICERILLIMAKLPADRLGILQLCHQRKTQIIITKLSDDTLKILPPPKQNKKTPK